MISFSDNNRHVAGKPHAELEGTAMEVSWPVGYRAMVFMKAVEWQAKTKSWWRFWK
jgi:hypothetical protein